MLFDEKVSIPSRKENRKEKNRKDDDDYLFVYFGHVVPIDHGKMRQLSTLFATNPISFHSVLNIEWS